MHATYKIFVRFLALLVFMFFQPWDGVADKDEYVVVIDAGHGGKDSGARGTKAKEKDIVLDVSLRVGKYIQENLPHIKVIYTRDDDTFVELDKRADIANKNQADLFVSIHANSSPSKRPYGTETFVMGLHKSESNLAVAQKENAVITLEENYTERYEGYDPHSAESYIIFSLMQNTHLDQSLRAAEFIQQEFREKARRKDRGVKQAGFLVLWYTSMPSILIEIGFISNHNEQRYLMSENGKDYLASAIYRAIRSFFNELQLAEKELQEQSEAIKKEMARKEQNNKNVFFSVQLTATSNEVDVSKSPYKELQDEIEMRRQSGLYKYFYGRTTNYKKAKEQAIKCAKYFPDAFIVAFEGDTQIEVKTALSKIKPD